MSLARGVFFFEWAKYPGSASVFDKSAQKRMRFAWFEVFFTCTVHRVTSLFKKHPPP